MDLSKEFGEELKSSKIILGIKFAITNLQLRMPKFSADLLVYLQQTQDLLMLWK
jgi:hypothetical protein